MSGEWPGTLHSISAHDATKGTGWASQLSQVNCKLWFANGCNLQVKLMNIMKLHIFPAIHCISNGSNYFRFLVTASTTYRSLKIADSFLCCISLTEERGHIIIWRGLTIVGGYIQLLLVYLIGTLYSINRWNCSHAFLWIQIYYYQECQTN